MPRRPTGRLPAARPAPAPRRAAPQRGRQGAQAAAHRPLRELTTTSTTQGAHVGTAEATSAQHAVWFTERAGVAGTAYHMAVGVRFAAGLDRRALVAACASVTDRHPILAARIVGDDDGTPRLAPADTRPTVGFAELTDARVTEEIARTYDLTTGPLARFTLLTDADDTHLLLVTAHHLVFDGMSKDILLRDLAAAYAAARDGATVDPGPRPDEYAGLATAEQQRVAVDLPAARDHWRRHWSGPGEVVLPGLR
ncbi:hypothetical protein EYA84_30835, partial [Verrucosispora sp. SN26_14.1]